ncbi:MAG: hypothetical protein U1G07_11460 [Verrucomicrobiota bacterium]
MNYLSVYSFESDWQKPGQFRSVTTQIAGKDLLNAWVGIGTALAIIRTSREQLINLGGEGAFNSPGIKNIVQTKVQAEPRASFRPPIRLSYALGRTVQGPGRSAGGIASVPAEFQEKIILTINVPFHLNTPPGVAAVNGTFTYYVDFKIVNRRPICTVFGASHPWAFESGFAGAGQNEINSGLDKALAQMPLILVQQLIQGWLDQMSEGSDLYLLPGAVLQPGSSPVTGDAATDMTLALVPAINIAAIPGVLTPRRDLGSILTTPANP